MWSDTRYSTTTSSLFHQFTSFNDKSSTSPLSQEDQTKVDDWLSEVMNRVEEQDREYTAEESELISLIAISRNTDTHLVRQVPPVPRRNVVNFSSSSGLSSADKILSIGSSRESSVNTVLRVGSDKSGYTGRDSVTSVQTAIRLSNSSQLTDLSEGVRWSDERMSLERMSDGRLSEERGSSEAEVEGGKVDREIDDPPEENTSGHEKENRERGEWQDEDELSSQSIEHLTRMGHDGTKDLWGMNNSLSGESRVISVVG
ncbi:hypothetical protein TREMEDRAFT_60397 [Tremella mesenterica DSM 1558]|uniref:uncharacterized protein n=1 Tax=Tremella mesenterica (strain ATCC 24925 / CBS 8224 / DSM 1558 / NBRC 9311 / NRRL Y-6157 / RJB 2259-6 / UBC 559-6) TaxID=578456 RepID=UPI0003F49E3D|nr:uncharacterized protein TREMEDRAFT_60397 [Tremella mesenterica DSM 1558]EIW71469.1 hypothetical protein TREMEDRAFT_60397 [Tremella mesenterica DSM 1558]